MDYEERQAQRRLEQEQKRIEQERKTKRRQAEIAALCTDLEALLQNPAPGINPLERQSAVLDCLFYTVMRENLRRDKINGSINEDRLHSALRIQKQCADTLKAHAAIEYMDQIGLPRLPVKTQPPLPALPHDDKQNGETE